MGGLETVEYLLKLARHRCYGKGLLWPAPLRRNEETVIFFGRSRETDALIAGLLRDADRRFLAIVGASGTGKSSLVYAGLLSRLAAGAIEGSATWRAF